MIATQTKSKTASAEPDFETAKARWAEADTKHREMLERREGMELARSMDSSGDENRVPPHLRERAKPFMRLAARRPQKLDDQLAGVEDEIADFVPKYGIELELWQAARRRETTRFAAELQPRHRAAVVKIAEALEALSRAMEEEAEIRSELASTAPETESCLLPNCIAGLVVGSLGDFTSPASDWARRMRKLEILG